MHLILFRHAKATARTIGVSDEARPLTPKGQKKARATALGLIRHLEDAKAIRIWASPAVRSRQTADILAGASGGKVYEYPAIYTGCWEELAPAWAALDNTDAVVIVGHEPYLGIWARLLTDATLPFRKCAAAGITITPPDFSAGTLEWFAGPTVLTKLGNSNH